MTQEPLRVGGWPVLLVIEGKSHCCLPGTPWRDNRHVVSQTFSRASALCRQRSRRFVLRVCQGAVDVAVRRTERVFLSRTPAV
ncbi:MAG: hypothetical protein GXP09_13350 [Gammaproteobacteria bacterium]|nr:hypothetical protein [Gammaproteobacteria bacterium]